MAKEKFLTVLVPIKDSDCESTVYTDLQTLETAVSPSANNINKIYKVEDGTYYRSHLVESSTPHYEYKAVVDREFPFLGDPMEIYDFTYDANRMGTAPTISAQGIMRFADGSDLTLDDLWNQYCHVRFNGENLYLKQVPTASRSNEDARYKYSLDFVSETVSLERVYLYDVVQPFFTEKPLSESSVFSFYGDINELAKRINASLISSGLATLTRKYVLYPLSQTKVVPYLTYEQWSATLVNPLPLIGVVYEDWAEVINFRVLIYLPLDGDYNRYLMEYIYENTDGVYDVSGYQCKIGLNEKGEQTTSEEKLISFENNTIHEALQQFHDTFELQYYIEREKDANGDFTGNTWIMVADCEHDFAESDYILLEEEPEDFTTNYSNYYKIVDNEYVALSEPESWAEDTYYKYDFIRDEDGLPTTTYPFDYGFYNELLSKEKNNTTDKIVTRITGLGSTDNIPWYYPNPNPDGWIRPYFTREGEQVSSVQIDYPVDEGTTIEDYLRYEKFLKNRIGVAIKKGVLKDVIFQNMYKYYEENEESGVIYITYRYDIDVLDMGLVVPNLTLFLDYTPYLSGCTRLRSKLFRDGNTIIGEYDSSESYQEPTAFQTMFINKNAKDLQGLAGGHYYLLYVQYGIPSGSMPNSGRFDFEGYHYISRAVQVGETGVYAYIGENFYDIPDLQPFVDYVIISSFVYVYDAGYSTNGQKSGKVSPIPRIKDKKYKDVPSGVVYVCDDPEPVNVMYPDHRYAFSESPKMDFEEWITTFVDMKLRVYANDGWYVDDKMIQLDDYGVSRPYVIEGGEPTYITTNIFDTIQFERLKWVTPQQNLLPEVYIKTNGERRFYNAHNYWDKQNNTLLEGTADTTIGEVQVDDLVRNPIYKGEETDPDSEHYEFETEYDKSLPHEHIENFDDVKPTIVGQKNYCSVSVSDSTITNWSTEYVNYFTKDKEGDYINATSTYDPDEQYYMLLRIDVIQRIAYDWTDNDEIWEDNESGNISGEYKHPYFFAQLRPMGFNIFDMALQEDMVISMTTGNCGACNFKIGVDEDTGKNPVQVWEYDVYRGETLSTATKVFNKGELRVYIDIDGLYFDTDGTQDGYIPLRDSIGAISGGMLVNYVSGVPMFDRYSYSGQDVANGRVGSMKQDKSVNHFEGDVVTNGRFIASQQDTSENYVWVALFKDTDTYGTIMPSARPNYNDPNLNVYIRPKSVADVHTQSSTYEDDEDNADKFVILNIKLPQVYLRRAEHELSRRLVEYMYEHNYQKFNFSINFSRIYLAQNEETDENLNENSVLYVKFNGRTYRQYVKHYSYRMSHDVTLPEIKVDMNEELSVSKSILEQWDEGRRRDRGRMASQLGKVTKQMQTRIEKNTVGKNSNSMAWGNVVIGETKMSLIELSKDGAGSASVRPITTSEIDAITSS